MLTCVIQHSSSYFASFTTTIHRITADIGFLTDRQLSTPNTNYHTASSDILPQSFNWKRAFDERKNPTYNVHIEFEKQEHKNVLRA